MAFYRYAEKFGCHPQQVPKEVTVRAFMRWLMLEKIDAAHEVWQRWDGRRKSEKLELSEEEKKLKKWTMMKDEY